MAMIATTESTERARGTRCCDPGVPPPLDAAAAQALTDDLAILAHPIRLRLLALLAAREGQVCVCDLEAAVPVKQPTVSHHLRLLREAGLIEVERDGLWAYYHVQHAALAALRARLAGGLALLG
jgi:ArsR family transcriptional regulator